MIISVETTFGETFDQAKKRKSIGKALCVFIRKQHGTDKFTGTTTNLGKYLGKQEKRHTRKTI